MLKIGNRLAFAIILGVGGACSPMPAVAVAPTHAEPVAKTSGGAPPTPSPVSSSPANVCSDDIPRDAAASKEHAAELAQTCDAAARCELACLRAHCTFDPPCAQACLDVRQRAAHRHENEDRALLATEAEFEQRAPNYCEATRPNAQYDERAHRLAKFAREHRSTGTSTSGSRTCQPDEERTNITEIAIERTACYGSCPVYSLTFHADGAVEYFGTTFVDHLGARHGRLEPGYFDELARLAEDIGWFGFERDYSCSVTDNPTVFTSIVRAGVRQTISHYAPRMSGPPRLAWFERTIDQVADYVDWSD